MTEARELLVVVTVLSTFFVMTSFPQYVFYRRLKRQRQQGRKTCEWYFRLARMKRFGVQAWFDSEPDEAILDTACVWMLFMGGSFLVVLLVCSAIWVSLL